MYQNRYSPVRNDKMAGNKNDNLTQQDCVMCLCETTFKDDVCQECGGPQIDAIFEKDGQIEDLSYENKMMAEKLISLGLSQDQIDEICSGKDEKPTTAPSSDDNDVEAEPKERLGYYTDSSKGLIFVDCGYTTLREVEEIADRLLYEGHIEIWRTFGGKEIPKEAFELLDKLGLSGYTAVQENNARPSPSYGVTQDEQKLYDAIFSLTCSEEERKTLFTKIHVSGVFKELDGQSEEKFLYQAIIGVPENAEEFLDEDDDIFYYFESLETVLGEHDDFIVTSFTFDEKVYYQPHSGDNLEVLTDNGYMSFDIWHSKDACQKEFPGCEIVTLTGDDIKNADYVDIKTAMLRKKDDSAGTEKSSNQSSFDNKMNEAKMIPSDRMNMCVSIVEVGISLEINISIDDAHNFWKYHSKSVGIKWLEHHITVDNNQEIKNALLDYIGND